MYLHIYSKKNVYFKFFLFVIHLFNILQNFEHEMRWNINLKIYSQCSNKLDWPTTTSTRPPSLYDKKGYHACARKKNDFFLNVKKSFRQRMRRPVAWRVCVLLRNTYLKRGYRTLTIVWNAFSAKHVRTSIGGKFVFNNHTSARVPFKLIYTWILLPTQWCCVVYDNDNDIDLTHSVSKLYYMRNWWMGSRRRVVGIRCVVYIHVNVHTSLSSACNAHERKRKKIHQWPAHEYICLF